MQSENLDPIVYVIKYFDKHPSLVKIKAKALDSTFHFRKTSWNEVEKIIINLNIKKSYQQEDILTKFIKQKNKDLIAKFIAEFFFSNRLKIEYVVLQGSILGLLLFNINSIAMFYVCEDSDVENYTDDTTPYACASVFLNYKYQFVNSSYGLTTIMWKPTLKKATYFWVSKLRK